MTIYLYSDIPYGSDAGSYAFDPDTDVLDIDTDYYSAADAILTDLADGSGVVFDLGAKTFKLLGATVSDLNQGNVVFTGGSMVVNSCEANNHATDLSGTAFDDLLLGSAPGQSPTGWTLRGGAGDDVYQIRSAVDHIVEAADQGIDTVRASVTYTLADNIEKLILAGTTAINGTGNSLDNYLTGNDANNVLDGGAGADTLRGGYGDDTYYVNSHTVGNVTTLDAVFEELNQGHDTMVTTVEYFLMPANVEDLVLLGSVGKGLGNSENNRITGNDANNDLDGGWGSDTLIGGKGGDLFTVDSQGDVVIELAGQGWDGVRSSVTYALGNNVEDLYLLGSGNINGTGNSGNNEIDGNSGNNVLVGGAGIDTVSYWGATQGVIVNLSLTSKQSTGWGSDTLSGFENLIGSDHADKLTGDANANVIEGHWGDDTMAGGLGNDTYEVDDLGDVAVEAAGGGVDRVLSLVDFTLGSMLENLTLLASTGAIFGTGNNAANDIVGNLMDNVLDGRGGADTMTGGNGSDTYVVDNAGDRIVEAESEGWDTVKASVSYTLQANVENLILTNSAAINGTGNAWFNELTGNAAANVLDGGAGYDTMSGGAGNDAYVVDSIYDVVNEVVGGGIDLVKSYVSRGLQDEVENLTLMGSASIDGLGNSLANLITGNAAGNQLFGYEGSDTLDGQGGADALYGGAGNDTYIVDNTADRALEQAGDGTDLVQSSVSFTLQEEVENLTLTGTVAINGAGNEQANKIVGNAANNVLNGNAGADTMTGGTGNDTYVVDDVGDKTVEVSDSGVDSVQSSISWTLSTEIENLTLTGTSAINGTGNTLANSLVGNSANNILNGGAGADKMTGGSGSDTYVVDNLGDQTIEAVGGGLDTVLASLTWALGTEVENLTLTGTMAIDATGSTKNNLLVGNLAANTLDGGTGADTMTGGMGSDTYIVDNTGDQTNELVSGGLDTVKASISWTLASEVENLTLTGASAINATGNTRNNLLVGNAAANTINGGAGADTMSGGSGSDTYVVDNAGDQTNELVGSGLDAVLASVSWTLSTEVENLTLTGTGAISATGNTKNNVLIGNAAANTLDGGAGADRLTGGAGADIFSFASTLGSDTITDFAHNGDKIRLSQSSLRVGDGDTVVEGAVSIAGPDGFSTAAELVIVTHDIAGDLTATSAAAAIGKASANYAVGDTRLFVVDNGHDTAVYLFKSLDNSATVTASELTLVTSLEGTGATSSNDYLFGA